MVVRIKLNNIRARLLLALPVAALCGLLGLLALGSLVAGTLGDQELPVREQVLAAAAAALPNSARLQARLAEVSLATADPNLARSDQAAGRAVKLSPWDYGLRLLHASVQESKGDRPTAAASLRAALALAPHNTDVRWRLGNLLLREGEIEASIVELSGAVGTNLDLLPTALDLLWRVGSGDRRLLEKVSGGNPRGRMILSQFLLNHEDVVDAVGVFGGIDRASRLRFAETPAFLDALIAKGHYDSAARLWLGLVSDQSPDPLPLVWNGSFESDPRPGLTQFDWNLAPSEFARISVDDGAGRTGSRSLRLDFVGRDTTRLDSEIRQLVLLKPGQHYRLECFVKTEGLITPEGPRVAVTSPSLQGWTVLSQPIAEGTADWQRMSFEFEVPQDGRQNAVGSRQNAVCSRQNAVGSMQYAVGSRQYAVGSMQYAVGSRQWPVVLSIKRLPKFVYDDPTRGTVWLDDFRITEIGG